MISGSDTGKVQGSEDPRSSSAYLPAEKAPSPWTPKAASTFSESTNFVASAA